MIIAIILIIAGIFTFFIIWNIISSFRKNKSSITTKTESGFFTSVYDSLTSMGTNSDNTSDGHSGGGFHGGSSEGGGSHHSCSHHSCSGGHSCSGHSCGGGH